VIIVRFLAILGLLLGGCIYVDPVVDRPLVTVHLVGQVQTPYRGEMVTVAAQFLEDGREGTYDWSVLACAGFDAVRSAGFDCAATVFDTSRERMWTFEVPRFVGGTAVESIIVQLEARDDRGVLALGGIQTFAIADRPPALLLRKDAHTFTVDAPIQVFARYSDPDDSAEAVSLDWKVFSPSTQPAFELDEPAGKEPGDEPGALTVSRRFVPHGAGEWSIAVTARDPLGEATEVTIPIVVAEDQPPCLAQWQPIAPPAGASLPVTAPTVLQVSQVRDDLDSHPQVTSDPVFGGPEFAWSILRPGASVREPLVGATGNSIDFDPRAFTPGDLVELRVEIFDRKRTAIPCADDAPTCSVISQPTCLQRLTWRLEVR
jgi:hypothetical protein